MNAKSGSTPRVNHLTLPCANLLNHGVKGLNDEKLLFILLLLNS